MGGSLAGKHFAGKVSFEIQMILKKSGFNPEESLRERRVKGPPTPIIPDILCNHHNILFFYFFFTFINVFVYLVAMWRREIRAQKGSSVFKPLDRQKHALREAFQLKVTSIEKKCHASK